MNYLEKEMHKPRQWFAMATSESNDVARFDIYDVIGTDGWGEGLRAIDFINSVRNAPQSKIEIHINSPGGNFFDGVAIYQELKRMNKDITTYSDAIAASSAATIFMAGNKRVVYDGAMLMIHNAWTIAAGNANDFAKMIDFLSKADEQISGIYSDVSGYEKKKIKTMMNETTYMDSKDATKYGFATEVEEGVKIAALAWDCSILPDLPDVFRNTQNAMAKREMERRLRDDGFSRKEAKAILSSSRDARDSEIAAALRKNIEVLTAKQ